MKRYTNLELDFALKRQNLRVLVAQERKLNAESALLEESTVGFFTNIAKAIDTLNGMMSRDGDTSWKDAQRVMRCDVQLALYYLNETNTQTTNKGTEQ